MLKRSRLTSGIGSLRPSFTVLSQVPWVRGNEIRRRAKGLFRGFRKVPLQRSVAGGDLRHDGRCLRRIRNAGVDRDKVVPGVPTPGNIYVNLGVFARRFSTVTDRFSGSWCRFPESWGQDGGNGEKTGKKREKMGEKWPKKSGGKLT